MAGKFIPLIQEMMGRKAWEDAKPLLFQILTEISEALPQVPIIASSGNPETVVQGGKGALVLNIDPDKPSDKTLFVKEDDDVGSDPTRGWTGVL